MSAIVTAERTNRRLAAILAADVVGYARLMGEDQARTLAGLRELRQGVFDPAVTAHRGHVVKSMGDGWIVEFASTSDAAACAVQVQKNLASHDLIRLRIGIHTGEIISEAEDVFGDGVNIAARLEQLAEPGQVLLSDSAMQSLDAKAGRRFGGGECLRLKNIHRPVAVWRWPMPAAPRDTPRPALAQPCVPAADKPSIAVLPFDNLSPDPDQDHLADGIVEDLITILSRFHWFRVIARSSSFACRGTALDVADVGARLGARYLLKGSVRRSGSRVRVAAQLVDTTGSTHLWADRFDREIEDVFDLQDEIVRSIVGTLMPRFVASFRESRQAVTRTTVSSWELAMRGWGLAWRQDATNVTMRRARDLFHQALDEDGLNTLAHSGIAFTYGNPFYLSGIDRDLPHSMAAARRAVEIDDQDGFGWCILGIAETWSNAFDDAARHLRRALACNPNLALACGYLSAISCWRADCAETDRWLARMKQLSPIDPALRFIGAAPAMARFGCGDYAGCLAAIDEVLARHPELPTHWRLRAASLEMLGRHAEARQAVREMLSLGSVTVEWIRSYVTPFVDRRAWDTYVDALRRAGVPTQATSAKAHCRST